MKDTEQKKYLSPQFKGQTQKTELKTIEGNIRVMKNRVELLKQQLQKQKDNIKKNKKLTEDIIQKKIEVNRINRYKQKDNSTEISKVQELRQRNKSMRLHHQREVEEIQKAIYLVKVDDARQAKNISIEHKKKIKEMEHDFLQGQKIKKQKVVEESQRAKQKYLQYWKQKLTDIYLQQAYSAANTKQQKKQKKAELKELEEEEIRVMEELNKYHSQKVESKKEYLVALNLPVKDVAQAVGQKTIERDSKVWERRSLNRSTLDDSMRTRSFDKEIKVPNANVNQEKLKLVLKELRKLDMGKGSQSSRIY